MNKLMHETKIPMIINDQIYEATTREIQCKTNHNQTKEKKVHSTTKQHIVICLPNFVQI